MGRREFRAFERSLPSRQGEVVVVCPKCGKIVRTYKERITKLNDWAFKDGVHVAFDAHGCCIK